MESYLILNANQIIKKDLEEYEKSIMLQKSLLVLGMIAMLMCLFTISVEYDFFKWISNWNPRLIGYLITTV